MSSAAGRAAPSVAVAVVSWNTRELLANCLESLAEDAAAGLADVWVLDNGSSDGSAAMVRERFAWVHLLERADNVGFGPAVNEIARRADAEWLAAANADVALAPGALTRMVDLGRSHPRVGAVAPQLITPDGAVQHSVHSFPSPALALLFNLGFHRVVPGLGDRLCLEGHWDPARRRRVPWAHGAFLLLRRSAFDEVGGFDPAQWMYAEDIDLQWRLSGGGWITVYEPAARAAHAVSAATLKAFGPERTARHTAASYAWLLRRRGWLAAGTSAALNALGAALRWAAAARPARLSTPGQTAKRHRYATYARIHARGLLGAGSLRRAIERPPALGEPER